MAIVLHSLKRLLALRISNSPHRHCVQRTTHQLRSATTLQMEYISTSENLYTTPSDPYWRPYEGSTDIGPQVGLGE